MSKAARFIYYFLFIYFFIIPQSFAGDAAVDFWLPERTGITPLSSQNDLAWRHRFRMLLGGSWFSGNIDSLIGTYLFKYKGRLPRKFELDVELNGRYVEVKGVKNSNNHTARVNPEVLLFNENFSITYIGMIQTQQFMDIYLRTTHELGLSYRFLRKIWWVDYSISAAPQYEYVENWLRNIKKDFNRLSVISELKFWFSKNKKNLLAITFSYSADMKKFKDYKTRLTVVLRLNITGILVSENKFEWNYASIPIENRVIKNDTALTTSIGIEL